LLFAAPGAGAALFAALVVLLSGLLVVVASL